MGRQLTNPWGQQPLYEVDKSLTPVSSERTPVAPNPWVTETIWKGQS